MSEYAVYCDKNHRSYRHLAGVGALADAITCLVSVNAAGQKVNHNTGIVCGAKVDIFKLPPVRASALLRAKFAADGWTKYWSWPGPKWLAARYTDPLILEENPAEWQRYVELVSTDAAINQIRITDLAEDVFTAPVTADYHFETSAGPMKGHTDHLHVGVAEPARSWEDRVEQVMAVVRLTMPDGDAAWLGAQFQKLKVLSTHANMGLASTRELLVELATRVDTDHGEVNLDYRTVGGDEDR